MAQVIKARVWQKVDTEANWNANPLILGPGEQAFVVNSAGLPINFKVGDGTKRFSQLPWSIQYAGGQYFQIVGNVLPAPSVDAGYSLVGPGTYTFSGQANIIAPEGRLSQLLWDGTSWSLVDMGELPQADFGEVYPFLTLVSPENEYGVKYIRFSDGEIVSGAATYNNYVFDVQNNIGSLFRVRSRNTSVTPAAIAFFSTDVPTKTSYMQPESIQAQIGYVEYETTIPAGVKSVVVSHRTDNGEQYPEVVIENYNSYSLGETDKRVASEIKKSLLKVQPAFLDVFSNKGAYVNVSGVIVTNPTYQCTDFLEITGADIVTDCRASALIAPVWFYDENYIEIDYFHTAADNYEALVIPSSSIPGGTKYIKVSDIIRDRISYVYSGVVPISLENVLNPEYDWFYQAGYVRYDTGVYVPSNNYLVTPFIKKPNRLEYDLSVRLTAAAIAFYNKDKVFISAIDSDNAPDYTRLTGFIESESFPTGTEYIRASTQSTGDKKLKFNLAEVYPDQQSSSSSDNKGTEKFFTNVLPKREIIYAAHFAGILRALPRIFPEMSIWSLQAAQRTGFRYVQCNSTKTLDGKRIMLHDVSLNRTMTDLEGNLLVEETLAADYTLEYIKENFLYRSDIPRHRTSIMEMTEFLRACNEYRIVPIFNNDPFTADEFNEIVSIVGDNFGIFSTTRQFDRSDVRYIVYCWRGSTLDTPEAAVAMMDAIGKPAIYGRYADVWNEELSDALKKAGYLRAPASVYKEAHWVEAKKWADFNVTDIFAPPSDAFSLIVDSAPDWSDFTHTGTIEDGLLKLAIGQSLTFESDKTYWIAKSILNLSYEGTLRISCCSMNPYNVSTGEWDYERNNGDSIIELTPTIVNSKATLRLTAVTETVISYVTLRITEC